MKCLLCENLSFSHICKKCQYNYLQPSLYTRYVEGMKIISFYKYSDIETLLLTKHTALGYYIFNILASCSLKYFSENFHFDFPVASLSVDDHNNYGYSHTAILNKSLKSSIITPYYGRLYDKSNVSYSGKTLQFRQDNPREFTYKDVPQQNIILVDDIVTTGLTLLHAKKSIKAYNKEILFALTLCSAEVM